MNPEQPIVTSENSDTILRGGLNEFQKRLLVQAACYFAHDRQQL